VQIIYRIVLTNTAACMSTGSCLCMEPSIQQDDVISAPSYVVCCSELWPVVVRFNPARNQTVSGATRSTGHAALHRLLQTQRQVHRRRRTRGE